MPASRVSDRAAAKATTCLRDMIGAESNASVAVRGIASARGRKPHQRMRDRYSSPARAGRGRNSNRLGTIARAARIRKAGR